MMELRAEQRSVLETLSRGLTHEQHVLQRYPDLTFQQFYNGLRRHDEPDGPVSHWAMAKRAVRDRTERPWIEWANAPKSILHTPLVSTLKGRTGTVLCCAYSSDGRRILSGNEDRTLKIWDSETGEEIITFLGHKRSVVSCAFSPGGERVVSGCEGGIVKVWDALSGGELLRLAGHSLPVFACSFSPGDEHVISACYEQVNVWNARTGERIATLHIRSGTVVVGAISPDGSRLVCAAHAFGTRILLDPDVAQEIRRITGPIPWVTGCSYPHGRAGREMPEVYGKCLETYDTTDGKRIAVLARHSAPITSCAYSPDSKWVVWGSKDGVIATADAETGQERAVLVLSSPAWVYEKGMVMPSRNFAGRESEVTCCAFSPDGRRIVTSSSGHMLRVWDAQWNRPAATGAGRPTVIHCLAHSPDGKRVVSSHANGELRVWDTGRAQTIKTALLDPSEELSSVFSPDGRLIVAAGRALRLRDAETLETLRTLDEATEQWKGSACSPDGREVLTVRGATAIVWELRTGIGRKLPFSQPGADYGNVACGYSACGRWVISERNTRIHRWDAQTGQELPIVETYHLWLPFLLASPEGKRLLACPKDHSIRVLDIETGKEIVALAGSTGDVLSCAWSPDGTQIASVGTDMALRVWDARTGEGAILAMFPEMEQPAHVLRRIRAGVTSAGFSADAWLCAYLADGVTVVTVHGDRSLRFWSIPHRQLIARFECEGNPGRLSVHPCSPSITVADDCGAVYFLCLRSTGFRPPVATAWRSPDGVAFGCPACRRWTQIEAQRLGASVDCLHCSARVRLGPFTIDADWHPVAKAWDEGENRRPP